MHILLAVDGSKNSLAAVASLIKHVDWFKKPPTVHLTYVHLPVPKVGAFGGGPSKTALANYYREEGEQAVAKAQKLLAKSAIPYETAILVGPIAETLCTHAENENCELICMGTRGLNSVANMVMGSVATKVLHRATVPVLLVK